MKTKIKLIEFISPQVDINLIHKEAYLNGNSINDYYDGIRFKLIILENKEVSFEEIDTNRTTESQRERILEDIISGKKIPFRKRMVIKDTPFQSQDGEVDYYLAIEFKKPIDKLSSLLKEAGKSDYKSTDQNKTNPNVVKEIVKSVDNNKKVELLLNKNFDDFNSQKLEELIYKRDKKLQDIVTANQVISDSRKEVDLLNSRISLMEFPQDSNGYYFFISNEVNSKSTLDDDILQYIRTKIQGLIKNTDQFMKIFTNGDYFLSIGKVDNGIVSPVNLETVKGDESVYKSIRSIGFVEHDDFKFIYNGDFKWHDLVNKLIKLGFSQDGEFDKISGSNSYNSKINDADF